MAQINICYVNATNVIFGRDKYCNQSIYEDVLGLLNQKYENKQKFHWNNSTEAAEVMARSGYRNTTVACQICYPSV
jgi:hypothetical protein